jgi:hypothetical protein
LGLLLAVVVTAANCDDGTYAALVLAKLNGAQYPVVSGQGVQGFVEPTGKECKQKLVSGKELATGRSPDAPHRTFLLPE